MTISMPGVSVLEARKRNGKWTVVRNSPYGRRITANTLMREIVVFINRLGDIREWQIRSQK